MTQTATKRQPNSGAHFTRAEFSQHFDDRARELVHLSGKQALKCIESGAAGNDAAWSELKLLSPLVKPAR